MSGYTFALVFGVLTSGLIFVLLRSRYMREKYAAIWIIVAVIVLVVALFPAILDQLAAWFGIVTPVNLVFFVGALALVLVCVQFSVEISRLEESVRVLAEEVAILHVEQERLGGRLEELGRALPAPGTAPGEHRADATGPGR